ncbi:hypothetical protein TCON_1344 [Astathelohania contejeani]|uniref:Exocyst complex component Sec10-like alpha-helical bundle domain-containing protein n=1 Tax=Astathelohania contejeani TaxID=164912 RepID=A0ABQ7HZ67_9MICR|nr:hypothetical protein TCON_1344 [Thelohania contejeani]
MIPITISQLKSKSFSYKKVIESSVDISDSPENIKSLENAIHDLINLKEGLIFKKEKLQAELNNFESMEDHSSLDSLKLQFSKLKINPLKEMKTIINIYSTIKELKTLRRIIDVYLNFEDAFPVLLESEQPDDWMFMCYALHEIALFIEPEHTQFALLRDFMVKAEEKMVNTFSRAHDSGEIHIMRSCYVSLGQMNKEYSIIKVFIFGLSIFKNEEKFEFKNHQSKTIHLDLFENEENTFVSFLKKIKKCYKEELTNLQSIFYDYEHALDIINKRIFQDRVSNCLDSFLQFKDPILFLLNLEESVKKLKELLNFMCGIYPCINKNLIIDDVISTYVAIASKREKESISILYNSIVKKHTKGLYYLNNKPVDEIEDPVNAMILIFKFSMERAKLLDYPEDEIEELTTHFISKIMNYFEMYINNYCGDDSLKLIDILCKYYLLIKKNITNINEEYFEKRIGELFDERIKVSQRKAKQIIKSQSIREYYTKESNSHMISKLIEFLKSETDSVCFTLKGQNGYNFIISFLNSVYLSLYKHILGFTFSLDQSRILINDMKSLLKCIMELGCIEIVGNYEYLVDIAELIGVDKENIKLYLSGIGNNIPKNELKNILKSRIDYSDIRKLIAD